MMNYNLDCSTSIGDFSYDETTTTTTTTTGDSNTGSSSIVSPHVVGDVEKSILNTTKPVSDNNNSSLLLKERCMKEHYQQQHYRHRQDNNDERNNRIVKKFLITAEQILMDMDIALNNNNNNNTLTGGSTGSTTTSTIVADTPITTPTTATTTKTTATTATTATTLHCMNEPMNPSRIRRRTTTTTSQTITKPIPSFNLSEIQLYDTMIGQGSFGTIYSIKSFITNSSNTTGSSSNNNNTTTTNCGSNRIITMSTDQSNNDVSIPLHTTNYDENIVIVQDNTAANNDDNDEIQMLLEHVKQGMILSTTQQQQQSQSQSQSQYVIKRLKPNLSIIDQARGMVDLAIEAKILLLVPDHPNIIKLRGIANTNTNTKTTSDSDNCNAKNSSMIRPDFFIILDQLQTTLDTKIFDQHNNCSISNNLTKTKTTKHISSFMSSKHNNNSNNDNSSSSIYSIKLRFLDSIRSSIRRVSRIGCMERRQQQKLQQRRQHQQQLPFVQEDILLQKRISIAYDLALAYNHLHNYNIVYRDIKPENIGFDRHDTVKIFDFGLCKYLSPNLRVPLPEYGYRLTGCVGSFPYMAPEVFMKQSYDTSCDVFSFAILLWEIITLQRSFDETIETDDYIEQVLYGTVRPPLVLINNNNNNKKKKTMIDCTVWSLLPNVYKILPKCWDNNPLQRPTMRNIVTAIEADFILLSSKVYVECHRTMQERQQQR